MLNACLTCGTPCQGRRCPTHDHLTWKGSTRQWRKTREMILARDQHRCHWCGDRATHVDHITPKVQGGSDEPTNLVAACETCNLSRGDTARHPRTQGSGRAQTTPQHPATPHRLA